MTGKLWSYQFAVHPGHRVEFPLYVRRLFNQVHMQVEEPMTEEQFWGLQRELDNAGFELHEVTRVPYFEPETVLV